MGSSETTGQDHASPSVVNDLKEVLPPLSSQEHAIYNSAAEHMNMFHENFRTTWNFLWSACSSNNRPPTMPLLQFIDTGLQFCQHLTMHHTIEEMHVFPVLSQKMPEFDSKTGILVLQHKEIHAGLDRLQDYLEKCRSREIKFEMVALKERMESWGEILWKHLDLEVETLGAQNMRKYWSVKEMQSLPM